MNACQVTPNQNMRTIKPPYNKSSRDDKSAGKVFKKCMEEPNRVFIQLRKKKVGPIKYKKTIKIRHNVGKRSKKKEKKSISETNIMEPGNPKKTNVFTKLTKKSFGQRKFRPLISVINRVLNRRLIASTRKKELVDSNAWLINIEKLANIRADWPLIIQIVSQCISITVEYATNFFKSIW